MIVIDGATVAFIIVFLFLLPVMRELFLVVGYLMIQAAGKYFELLFEAPIVVNLVTLFTTIFIAVVTLISTGVIAQ